MSRDSQIHADGQEIFEPGGKANPLELKLVDAIEKAQSLKFDKGLLTDCGDGCAIRASFLRAILGGLPISNLPPDEDGKSVRKVHLTPYGIRVETLEEFTTAAERLSATRLPIVGKLDLASFRKEDGSSLPPIQLSFCDFDGVIDVSSARLSWFNLSGSRFDALIADETEFSGSVNLTWCGPRIEGSDQHERFPFAGTWVEGPGDLPKKRLSRIQLAWIKGDEEADDDASERRQLFTSLDGSTTLNPCVVLLRRAHVDGMLNMNFSDFVRKIDDIHPSHPSKLKLKYAVNLSSAYVRDSINASETVILGGMDITGIEVGEDVWMSGSRLIAYASDRALKMQLASIQGMLAINRSFFDEEPEHCRAGFQRPIVFGSVLGIGLRAREVWLGGGFFCCGLLGLPKANVDQSISIGGYSQRDRGQCIAIAGRVDLSNVDVGKNIELHHAKPIGDIEALLETEFVKGFLRLATPNTGLEIRAQGARISRRFFISSSTLVNASKTGEKFHSYAAVDLWKSKIGTGFRIGKLSEVTGCIALNQAQIDGEVKIHTHRVGPESPADMQLAGDVPVAISLDRATVNGEVLIGGSYGQPSTIGGRVSLSNTAISGSVAITFANFQITARKSKDSDNRQEQKKRGDFLRERTILSLSDCNCSGELRVRSLGFIRLGDTGSATKSETAIANSASAKLEPPALAEKVRGKAIRTHELSFYDDIVLAEIPEKNEVAWVLYDLRKSEPLFRITGKSPPIHALNERLFSEGRFKLDTTDQQKDYLTFFCRSISGDEGPFRIVENVEIEGLDDNDWSLQKIDLVPGIKEPETDDPDTDDRKNEDTADSEVDDKNTEKFKAHVFYSNALFEAEFALDLDTGMVEMLEDKPIRGDIELTPVPGFWQPKQMNPQISERGFFGVGPTGEQSEVVEAAFPAKTIWRTVVDAVGSFRSNLKGSATKTKWSGQSGDIVEEPGTFDDERLNAIVSHTTVVDLRGFSCRLLNDLGGEGWNLQNFVKLRAEGISCARVESTPSAAGGRASGSTLDDLRVGLKDSTGQQTHSSRSKTAQERLVWLEHQRSIRPADENEKLGPFLLSKFVQSRLRWADEIDFIPQTYEEFATNYLRSGEREVGRNILKQKKDMEASIRFWKFYRRFWDAPRSGDWARLPLKLLQVGLLFAVVGVAMLVGVVLGSQFNVVDPNLVPWLAGIGGLCVVIAFLPQLEAFFTSLFRECFDYGLTPYKALITFALCIAIGWAGVHWARTGSAFDPHTDWEALESGGELDGGIALVLDVAYQSDEEGGDEQGTRVARQAVVAKATPCNFGVSSLLYAMDVFVPLIDLDQRRRCTIREEREASGQPYFGWRLAKTIYEILGWIITSLVILTISGAMRRDIER